MENRSRILVADDEEPNRLLIREALKRRNYDVILACDGEEAIRMVAESSPDVVLLDVNMPNMNGFEAARRLKEDNGTRHIPIVMITGLSDIEYRIQALEIGVDDYLTKPVDIPELTARVRSLVKVKAYYDHMRNYQKELEEEVARRTKQLETYSKKLQVALEKIKSASLDSIYRLSRAAEYKDEDTSAHLKRMSNYAVVVGRKMGLGEKTLEYLLYAAPMHDVGKIGIPDRILSKPGKLDPDEWEIMKQHTIIGARILENSLGGFNKLAEVIALTHHEKWDGSGYPYGLKGSKIPLVGRITAIADVFDALTSKRPYKEAYSFEKSVEIIEAGRGSHFDPRVVDAFLASRDEILQIKERYKEEGAENHYYKW